VYEDLLGDLLQIENNEKSTPKPKIDQNGNFQTTAGGATMSINISSDIEDIFDADLFDLNAADIEKHSNYLLTDQEDDEEEESIEGADPNSTQTLPKIDVFDCILMDLDEKTKEMEKQKEQSCQQQGNKIKAKKQSKHNKHSKKKRRKRNRNKHKPKASHNHARQPRDDNNEHGKTEQQCTRKSSVFAVSGNANTKHVQTSALSELDDCKESLEDLKRFKQTQHDSKMLHIRHIHELPQSTTDDHKDEEYGDNEQEVLLNPWILRQWEYKENHKRRSLRTLLTTLNEEILWKEMLSESSVFQPCKLKDIVYEADCVRMYVHAVSVFNRDKSIERGDSIQQQIICAWVHDALQCAYRQMVRTKE